MDLLELVRQAGNDNEVWFPKKASDAFYHAAAMAGEVGEVLNLLKKIERGDVYNEDEMAERLNDEVADVFTYLLSLCSTLGIDLELEYMKKRDYNELRFRR